MLTETKYYITKFSLLPLIITLLIIAFDMVILAKNKNLNKIAVLSHFKNNYTKYISVFFVILIYNATVFSRIGKMHFEPFSDIFGGWGIIYYKYTTNYACILNIALFAPLFSVILHFLKKNNKAVNFKAFILNTIALSLGISLSIELLQAILRVGTFQISDLVYNTLGGFIGALIYYIINKAKGRKNSSE